MIVDLSANRPAQRFYRGGPRIVAFRAGAADPGAVPVGAEREPEDWIASVTTVFGQAEEGMTRLADGTLLRDAVAADPVGWLGAEHVARWGDDPQLLVKLLDAGQRLPVHAHPDDDFAATRLGHRHGKAEAWYILSSGTVHVGLRRPVSEAELAELVGTQRVEELLGLLHPVRVSPGDVVWVPPGELHAIGAGVLLLELQQPEDLSILLEWRDFSLDGERDGHVGLGFGRALGAVSRRVRTEEELAELVSSSAPSGSVLPAAADRFFRLERRAVDGGATIDAGYAIVVVVSGRLVVEGGLEPGEGDAAAPAGRVLLVPASHGPVRLRGAGDVLVARPPRPAAVP